MRSAAPCLSDGLCEDKVLKSICRRPIRGHVIRFMADMLDCKPLHMDNFAPDSPEARTHAKAMAGAQKCRRARCCCCDRIIPADVLPCGRRGRSSRWSEAACPCLASSVSSRIGSISETVPGGLSDGLGLSPRRSSARGDQGIRDLAAGPRCRGRDGVDFAIVPVGPENRSRAAVGTKRRYAAAVGPHHGGRQRAFQRRCKRRSRR